MNILVDINHPGHVHFFKHFIKDAKKNGHTVIVTASDKDIAIQLLDEYKIEYIMFGSYGKSMISKLINLPILSLRLAYIALKYKIDLLIGISFRVAHAGWFTGKKSYVFDDTEHAVNEIRLYKPFATKIFTPDCFTKDLGKMQVRYPGYHELAYLHPNRFKPHPEVLKEIGLKEVEPFFVLRFVSWGASHDIGQKGFSDDGKRKLIDYLKDKGKIIITSESPLPKEFEEYRMSISITKMHDLLYYSKMYIGESPTMATESAILGTKSFLINSWAYNIGNMIEISKNYNLMKVYRYENEFFDNFENDIADLETNYKEKHKKFLKDKIDVTEYLINMIENEKV